MMRRIPLLASLLSWLVVATASAKCPITDETTIVYSKVNGVGPASLIWVQDLLWWWKAADPSVSYVGLTSSDFQECDLASFPNLKIYLNPGGNAYDQLQDVGAVGGENIKRFVQRNQSESTSAYVGICAGGYMASHDFLWSSQYEGTDYFDFKTNPPFSLFPHTVEGSLVDISDDEHGDQQGHKYRMVNMSNGHSMLYYGGSTFGYNAVPDYGDPLSPDYDPNVQVLLYYSDFYGQNSANLPAAWKYGQNILLTGPHPEADNCTLQDNGNDCPPPNTLPDDVILQNRAWLCTYMNEVAGTSFTIPDVPVAPVFNTTRPHGDLQYPRRSCYDSDDGAQGQVLFCNDFDVVGRVPEGLAPSFQRNQTLYNGAMPWNVTYVPEWNDGVVYGPAHSGNGYAYSTPKTPFTTYPATITSVDISVAKCAPDSLSLSFAYKGSTLRSGYFIAETLVTGASGLGQWVDAFRDTLYPAVSQWQPVEATVLVGSAAETLKLRFSCSSGSADPAFHCAVDTIFVRCGA